MKFYCKQEDILNEIVYAMDFAQQKSSLTMLSNIFIEARNNTLTLKATDNASGFISQIPIESVEDGSLLVFGAKLLDTVRLLPSTRILFEQNGQQLTITPEDTSIKFNSSLKTMDATEFPVLSVPEENEFFSIGQKAFITMGDQTNFAIGTDDTRQFLCGLYLEHTKQGMNMVATDSRRLSLVERAFSETIPDFPSVIFPLKFYSELKKIAPGDGVMDLCVRQNAIYAKVGNRMFYTTLIKGPFPEYRRVLPQHQTHHCLMNIKEMVDAIRRVSISIDSKVCKIYLDITPEGVTLYSEGTSIGDAKETISCQYDGEKQTICLNYVYLLSPLKVMEGEHFTFNFIDPSHSITLCPEGERDYYHLIMPMQPGI